LHCLSTKSGSWDQFGSSIAVALICLSDGRRFNWSSYIFRGMIQRAVAFTRGLKRDGSPMSKASSKKLKTGDVEVDVEAPSQDVSREKVDAPSHSQNIPEAQVEVPSQEVIVEDVEVPSNIASKAQQTASSLKKVGTKKKRLGRKGGHTSQTTIPIKAGDPDTEYKLCIKYASDEDSASDCDTPVHLYAVVNWELLPTRLGSINAIYRLDNSRKYFTSLREILHLVMTFYQDKKAEGVGLVLSGDLKILMDSPEVNDGINGLVIHMFVDKKYPLSINLIKRMLDHQLEICHGTVGIGCWLTTTQQMVFNSPCLTDKKELIHHEVEMVINPPWIMPLLGTKGLVSPNANGFWYVVPTGRVAVPTGRYVVPAGKVIIIVSTGRLSLVPTGRILSPGRVK
ncbi:hypothetical protein Tco_0832876, partial [Tanacetum coccineum]